MSDAFHWNMQSPQSKTYAERAEECRRLAKVCPEHFRDSYLEMAAEYEQLATEPGPKWEPPTVSYLVTGVDDNGETLSALRSWASKNGNVRELWLLFGSRATGRARPESDVELALYLMLHDWALGSYIAHWKKWKGELEAILGHKVDIGALGPGTKLEEEMRRNGKCLWVRDSQASDKED